MRRLAPLLAAALLTTAPAPAAARSTPFSLQPEAVAGGFGVALGLTAGAWIFQRDRPTAPPTADDVPWFDAWSLSARARTPGVGPASDVLLIVMTVAPVITSAALVAAEREPFEDFATDAVVYLQAQAINVALNAFVKRLVRRPRPYTLHPDFDLALAHDGAFYSFYSGHTSTAFTAAAALSMTVGHRHPAQAPWVWPVSMAGAATVAALRIAGGDHYLSDVFVGALVGTAIGVLVPWLHLRDDPPPAPTSAVMAWSLSGSF